MAMHLKHIYRGKDYFFIFITTYIITTPLFPFLVLFMFLLYKSKSRGKKKKVNYLAMKSAIFQVFNLYILKWI